MFLYHYYDKEIGPFLNLSDLSADEASAVLSKLKREKPHTQSAQRDPEYMFRRRMYEDIIKKEFIKKGGIVKRDAPHYMVVEHSPWLSSWFENSAYIRIPIEEFDLKLFLLHTAIRIQPLAPGPGTTIGKSTAESCIRMMKSWR